eukprot:2473278-Karenia_brevis.AAC.1
MCPKTISQANKTDKTLMPTSMNKLANTACKRPPTWGEGVPDSRFAGLEGSWKLVDTCVNSWKEGASAYTGKR